MKTILCRMKIPQYRIIYDRHAATLRINIVSTRMSIKRYNFILNVDTYTFSTSKIFNLIQ